MQILTWDDLAALDSHKKYPVALTIGVFDGLHSGHQKLLDAVKEQTFQTTSLLVSFRNNPATVLRADSFLGDINSYRQKLKNFQLYGIDVLVLIDFSLNFSKMTGREFWNVLLNRFDIRKVVIGKNFYFGNQRDTHIQNLNQIVDNCTIEIIEPVLQNGMWVSSTAIRHWIKEGDVKRANQLLFQNFAFDLQDASVREKGLLKKDIAQIFPSDGLYEVSFKNDNNLEKGLLEIKNEAIRVLEPGSVNLKYIQEIIFIEKKA